MYNNLGIVVRINLLIKTLLQIILVNRRNKINVASLTIESDMPMITGNKSLMVLLINSTRYYGS